MHGILVPLTGLEPVRYRYRGILSPLRLPVPPPRQTTKKENKNGGDTQNRTGDKGFADLCLTAWLCRLKRWSGKRDSNSRPPPWQGGALPLSYFRIGDPDGTRTHDLRRDRAAF